MSRRKHLLWPGLAGPALLWLTLLYVAPIALVLAMSFASTDFIGRPVYTWQLGNYHTAFQPQFLPTITRSLMFAALVAAICLVIGYPTAYVMSKYGGRYRNLLMLAALVPWLVDYLIRIYAWIQILGGNGLIVRLIGALGLNPHGDLKLLNTSPAVILGLVYNYLPLLIVMCFVAVEQLDDGLIEAGKDLYGRPLAVFLGVTIPNTLSGIVPGVAVVFLLALGDWATVFFLGGPQQFMIGNLIQNQYTSAGSLPFGAALTVLLLAVVMIVIVIAAFAGRRLSGRRVTFV